MTGLLDRLGSSDRRSIGRSDELVDTVLAAPGRVTELFAGLAQRDPVIRARAAGALEMVSRRRPDLIGALKSSLPGSVARAPQAGLRSHVAQMLSRPALTRSERETAIDLLLLKDCLETRSGVVRTCALQAIAGLANGESTCCEAADGLTEGRLRRVRRR